MNKQEILEVLSAKYRAGAITRRQFVQAAAFFGLGAGVAPLAAAAAPAPARRTLRPLNQDGSEVRFLIAEAFADTWDPYQHTIQAQRRIEQQIFDTLWQVETADVGAYSPGLAESWTQVDDLTVECTLRQGVTFHKGQPFTAADVKASIERASGATGEEVVSALSMVPTTVEVVDDFTVRLKTETPFAPLFGELASLPILSAADVQPAADPATPAAGAEGIKAAPNGTGPFMLVGNEPNIKTMEANSGYWGGAPAIQTLVWEYIIDSQTRLNALLAGQAHVLDRVPPEHLAVLQADPNITLISNTGFENVNLWMRQDAPAPWDYANVKLREAVMWGVDRQGIVESLVQGGSEVSVTHIPNHALFAQPQEPAYAFDLEKARAAKAEAGFPNDGEPELPLWGVTGFLPRGEEVAEAMVDSLTQVGFRVTLQMTDVAAIIDGLFSPDKPGVFFHLSWSSNGDPNAALKTLYHSPGAWTGASDATIDDLMDRGNAAVNPEERAALFQELQAYLWQNLVHLPLYNSDFTVAHVNDLQGLVALPNFATLFKKVTLTTG